MPHEGPMGVPRPLISCTHQIVVILEGRDGDVDESAMAQEIEQDVNLSVSVSTRQARFVGDKEVVVKTRSNIVNDDQVRDAVDAVDRQLRKQGLGFQVEGWRVES